MKGILILCALTLVVLVAFAVSYFYGAERYGETGRGVTSVALDALVAHPQKYSGQLIRVEGIITEQCRATGCYFYFTAGDKKIKIELDRILTTLARRERRRAIVEGEVTPFEDGFQVLATALEIL